jgi:membrane protease YdiL (CAAX protease family)
LAAPDTAPTPAPTPEATPGHDAAPPADSPPPNPRPWPVRYTRRLIYLEITAVLALSLGRDAVSSLISLIGSLTAAPSLPQQTATLNGSAAPGRPWLDLSYQVYGVAFGLAPVLLVAYLLAREHASLRDLGMDRTRPLRDLAYGAAVAAVIGGSGLALYLGAHAAGLALTVVPTTLPDVWWRIPILIASAFQNAALEEVVVLGYLLRRFDQAGWRPVQGEVTSALIRGSYHLYQGFGGFVGNFVMGLIFAKLYRRWGRAAPMFLAHGLIDTTAFVGYALLAGHVSWIPV